MGSGHLIFFFPFFSLGRGGPGPPGSIPVYIYIYIATYFKNLIVELYVFYILKIHVKFRANQILFNTQSINLFLCVILGKKYLEFIHFL